MLKKKCYLQYYHQCLSVLCNYFDGPTKLFPDLYQAKFLNNLTKPFFSCTSSTAETFQGFLIFR